MKKQIKKIPRFKNEDEERDFWSTHSTIDYIENFEPVEFDLSHLKPSTKSITLRLPVSLLDKIRRIANKRDVPYQSLMKMFLDEKASEFTS